MRKQEFLVTAETASVVTAVLHWVRVHGPGVLSFITDWLDQTDKTVKES